MSAYKSYPIIMLALALAVLASGCTSSTSSTAPASSYPMAVTDDMGRTMMIPAPPQRIVSLAPSNTELLYALGLGDRIVGVDVNSNYPAAALQKPTMGGMVNVSVGDVIAARPDLVLVSQFTPADAIDQLEARGLAVYSTHPDNVTAAERAVLAIGRICGVPARAEEVYNRMKADAGPILEETSRLTPERIPSVLMIITLEPRIYVADPGNYMDDLIRMGGGRNVATGPVMTPEEIVAADPDVIIVPLTYWTQATYDNLSSGSEPWMSGLKAVRNHQVYPVSYDLVGRPGPRLGAAASEMAAAIHPEIFL